MFAIARWVGTPLLACALSVGPDVQSAEGHGGIRIQVGGFGLSSGYYSHGYWPGFYGGYYGHPIYRSQLYQVPRRFDFHHDDHFYSHGQPGWRHRWHQGGHQGHGHGHHGHEHHGHH